ncbi:hypothetical protein AcV7_000378 [Taiwanofungus camphoratus]|nr:hypothetical protein AcV7_000378 [Antrodia cinnamomea]
MNALPSPPLHPHHQDHPRLSYPRSHQPDSTMEALMSSVWHSIQQSPPPSLRDILDAYKAKGDGDRDMLVAMLNAKSAEDQRIASVSSLQRAMLDLYHPSMHLHSAPIPPLRLPDPHQHYAPSSAVYPPAVHFPSPPNTLYHHSPHHLPENPYTRAHRRAGSSGSATSNSQSQRERPAPSSPHAPPRKRRRTSRSPPPARSSRPDALTVPLPSYGHGHGHDLPLPPSPYSSASSAHSGGGSPRSRESMTIGALLSAQSPRARAENARRVSSERSTSAAGGRDSRDGHS